MGSEKEEKRKKGKRARDDDNPREKKSKRARTRSRSPREASERYTRRKRKHSRSVSAERMVKNEKEDNQPRTDTEVKTERKRKEPDMLNTRTGGAYIPPARLRMMQAQITDKSTVAYQRLAWEALKKSIHGHINKINVGNIGVIIKELLKENIVRGRGHLCRSVIQAQAASPTFTNVYAALVAAVNSRFPNIGELLLKRLVIQFKRGFKRNDKPICISSASFIAHLVNQRVAHEILALELLTLLVETPTDDSVEVAISFLKECGQKLTEVSSKGCNAIFEMLRNILHEGQLDKRVQYMIEVMFQVWKDGFKDHPALIEELELVPEEEQFTHLLMLDDATDAQDILNVFKFDEKYEENENKYATLCKEILGSDAESNSDDGSGESGSEESDEEDYEQKPMTIIDNTETNLVALRRTVYLTINSSLDFEECAHKLMKMQLKPGQEVELCHMFLDCCAEQRTYEKFYGLLAQRFCNINRIYIGPFEEIFKDSYGTAHRLDTNRLRNVSKFFAHLLFTDSIGWEVMECVKLNEEDTTSSSRIYIKILFQELAEYMGLKKLNDRLQDPTLFEAFRGVFPRDNPKNTRFSINFFTSIGLGGLTDALRDHLKQMPKAPPAPLPEIDLDSGSSDSESSSSSSSSSSSDSDSSTSDSDSDEDKSKTKTAKSKSKKKDKGKNKEKPKSSEPKDDERWGHDGFYDTYGKDATREDHAFARPRNVGRPENRTKEAKRSEEDTFWVRDGRTDDNRRNKDDKSERRDERTERLQNDKRNERGARDNRQDDRSENRRQTDDRREYDVRGSQRNDNGSDNRRERERDDGRPKDRNDDRSEVRSDRRQNDYRRDRERDDVRQKDRNDDRSDRRQNDDRSDKQRDRERDNVREKGRFDDRSEDRSNKRQDDDRSDKRRDRERDDVRQKDRNDDRSENISDRRQDDDRSDKQRDRERDDVKQKDRNDDKRTDGSDRRQIENRSDNRRDREKDFREERRQVEDKSDKRKDRDSDKRKDYEERSDGHQNYDNSGNYREKVRRDNDASESRSVKENRSDEKKRDYRAEREDKDRKIDKEREDRPDKGRNDYRSEKSSKSDRREDKENYEQDKVKDIRRDDDRSKKSDKEDRRRDETKEKLSRNKKRDSSSSESSSDSSSDSDSDESAKQKKKADDGWDIRGGSVKREIHSRYWEN